MRPHKKFFDLSYLLLVPFLMSAFIPVINRHLRILYTFPFFILFFYFSPALQRNILKYGHFNQIKGLFGLLTPCFFLFGGYALLYKVLRLHGGFSITGSGAYLVGVLSFILIFHNSLKYMCLRELDFINKVFLLCLFIATLYSVRAEFLFGGGASRQLTGMSAAGADLLTVRDAFDLNAAGYAHVYGVGLLALPLLYLSKYFSRVPKYLFRTLSFSFFALAYLSMYSILVLSFTVSAFILLASYLGISKRFIVFTATSILILFSTSVLNPTAFKPFVPMLLHMADQTDEENYKTRLLSISDHISGSPDTYVAIRTQLYIDSWRSFLNHPFVGTYGTRLRNINVQPGGHSFILDGLGQYGFMFLVFVILFIWKYFEYYNNFFHGPYKIIWIQLSGIYWVQFLFIALLNPMHGYVFYFSIFVLFPGIVIHIQNTNILQPSNPKLLTRR